MVMKNLEQEKGRGSAPPFLSSFPERIFEMPDPKESETEHGMEKEAERFLGRPSDAGAIEKTSLSAYDFLRTYPEPLPEGYSLEQLWGLDCIRIRTGYPTFLITTRTHTFLKLFPEIWRHLPFSHPWKDPGELPTDVWDSIVATHNDHPAPIRSHRLFRIEKPLQT